MLRHVVLFRWAPEATVAQIEAVRAALADLPEVIPEICDYRFGPDAQVNEGGWDFALVADFASVDDYLVYRDHPRHREVVQHTIQPLLGDIARVQYETHEPTPNR